jgi:hypothetical protein
MKKKKKKKKTLLWENIQLVPSVVPRTRRHIKQCKHHNLSVCLQIWCQAFSQTCTVKSQFLKSWQDNRKGLTSIPRKILNAYYIYDIPFHLDLYYMLLTALDTAWQWCTGVFHLAIVLVLCTTAWIMYWCPPDHQTDSEGFCLELL